VRQRERKQSTENETEILDREGEETDGRKEDIIHQKHLFKHGV